MPELAIRHFQAIDYASRTKNVGAGLGVGDRNFDAGSLGILFGAGESEPPFGNIFTNDDDIHA
jgi:hypothetical protein